MAMSPRRSYCHSEAVHVCCMLPRVQSLLAPNGVNQYGTFLAVSNCYYPGRKVACGQLADPVPSFLVEVIPSHFPAMTVWTTLDFTLDMSLINS